jgi:hypothetical protein
VSWLGALGAAARVVGSGAVVAQSVRPGAELTQEVTLTLR